MQKSCTQYVCITIELCAGILTLATFFFKFLFPLFKAKHLHRKIQTTKFEPNNIRQYQSICKLIKYCPTVQPSCFFSGNLIGWLIKSELAEFSQCYTTDVKIMQVHMLHMNTLYLKGSDTMSYWFNEITNIGAHTWISEWHVRYFQCGIV